MGFVDSAFEIIDDDVWCYPAEISKHPLLDCDEGGKLLIEDEFLEG